MANARLIFAGPSFANSQLVSNPDITIHPPCKQGDVYLASRNTPAVIAIVDGYFEGAPSVWHKEILWALSQGIHVVGAASMGALRAAETDSYGMRGIGVVYESYRDGLIEDDDEVALLHGPPGMNYVSLSLAMVNVRATLSRAVDCGRISEPAAQHILLTAKRLFYKDRNWETLLDRCDAKLVGETSTVELRDWLSDNEVDQKRLDAEALYKLVSANDFSIQFKPDFTFEETEYWHQCTRKWVRQEQWTEQKPDPGGYRLFG
jgi:hypothetical protein